MKPRQKLGKSSNRDLNFYFKLPGGQEENGNAPKAKKQQNIIKN